MRGYFVSVEKGFFNFPPFTRMAAAAGAGAGSPMDIQYDPAMSDLSMEIEEDDSLRFQRIPLVEFDDTSPSHILTVTNPLLEIVHQLNPIHKSLFGSELFPSANPDAIVEEDTSSAQFIIPGIPLIGPPKPKRIVCLHLAQLSTGMIVGFFLEVWDRATYTTSIYSVGKNPDPSLKQYGGIFKLLLRNFLQEHFLCMKETDTKFIGYNLAKRTLGFNLKSLIKDLKLSEYTKHMILPYYAGYSLRNQHKILLQSWNRTTKELSELNRLQYYLSLGFRVPPKEIVYQAVYILDPFLKEIALIDSQIDSERVQLRRVNGQTLQVYSGSLTQVKEPFRFPLPDGTTHTIMDMQGLLLQLSIPDFLNPPKLFHKENTDKTYISKISEGLPKDAPFVARAFSLENIPITRNADIPFQDIRGAIKIYTSIHHGLMDIQPVSQLNNMHTVPKNMWVITMTNPGNKTFVSGLIPYLLMKGILGIETRHEGAILLPSTTNNLEQFMKKFVSKHVYPFHGIPSPEYVQSLLSKPALADNDINYIYDYTKAYTAFIHRINLHRSPVIQNCIPPEYEPDYKNLFTVYGPGMTIPSYLVSRNSITSRYGGPPPRNESQAQAAVVDDGSGFGLYHIIPSGDNQMLTENTQIPDPFLVNRLTSVTNKDIMNYIHERSPGPTILCMAHCGGLSDLSDASLYKMYQELSSKNSFVYALTHEKSAEGGLNFVRNILPYLRGESPEPLGILPGGCPPPAPVAPAAPAAPAPAPSGAGAGAGRQRRTRRRHSQRRRRPVP